MSQVKKIHPVRLTAVTKSSVRAIVSIFGNVDRQGDRVMPGAFTKSLAKWRASNKPIPGIWSHEWTDPMAYVAKIWPANIRETDVGLEVELTDWDDTPFARQVYQLLKDRRVTEWSFAYDVVRERMAKDGANELLEVDLIEAGPTLKGANPETELLGVKAVGEMLAREDRERESRDREVTRPIEYRALIAAINALDSGDDVAERTWKEYVHANLGEKTNAELVDRLNRLEARAIVNEVRRAQADEDEMSWDLTQRTTRGLGDNPR